MQIVREPTGDSTMRLNEILHVFTPPMLRVCAHMPDSAIRAMVERMAHRKLQEEEHSRTRMRRLAGARRRPCRTVHAYRAMSIAN